MVKKIIKLVIFVCLCAGVYFTQVQMDSYSSKLSKYYVEKNLLITLPTSTIKMLTFGFDNLLSDIAWLQFIQYYGENNIIKLSGSKDYDFSYSYKYIDVVTALDPEFAYAYWFGAFAIADEMEKPDLAIDLINKGIKNNPKNWWLPYTAAVLQLMYKNNFVEAEKYIDKAYILKPDDNKIKVLKEVLHSKAQKQEKTKLIWVEIYKDAARQGDTITMERAKRKLEQLGYTISEN